MNDQGTVISSLNELIDSVNAITNITELKIGRIMRCRSCNKSYEGLFSATENGFCSVECERKLVYSAGKDFCGKCGSQKLKRQSCIRCL